MEEIKEVKEQPKKEVKEQPQKEVKEQPKKEVKVEKKPKKRKTFKLILITLIIGMILGVVGIYFLEDLTDFSLEKVSAFINGEKDEDDKEDKKDEDEEKKTDKEDEDEEKKTDKEDEDEEKETTNEETESKKSKAKTVTQSFVTAKLDEKGKITVILDKEIFDKKGTYDYEEDLFDKSVKLSIDEEIVYVFVGYASAGEFPVVIALSEEGTVYCFNPGNYLELNGEVMVKEISDLEGIVKVEQKSEDGEYWMNAIDEDDEKTKIVLPTFEEEDL